MKTLWQPTRATLLCSMVFAFGTSASAEQAPAASSATTQPTQFFANEAIDDAALQTVTGREDNYQVATAKQSAAVANNSVGNNVQTGDARIDGNAFQNLSGMSVLSVNTGNNVAINAAMNVNISINPAP